MSDNAVAVIRLDHLAEGDVAQLAATLARWLISEGIIEPNAARDAILQPDLWMPGPSVATALAEPDDDDATRWFPQMANRGVQIATERTVAHPGGNFEPARCSQCATQLTEDVYLTHFQTWLDASEPEVACAQCGSAAPIGDWVAPYGLAVGAPCVTFHNWPPLSEDFVAEVRRRLAGRTTVIHQHL